jgi:hypothetical protein
MSFYSDASLALIPSGYKNGKVYSALPTDGSGDLSFTRASNATRVASNGLIEKVRTNVLLQSNTFSTWSINNASLTGGQSGYDGTNTAWLIKGDTTTGRHNVFTSNSLVGEQTLSIYAKAGGHSFLQIAMATTVDQYANFDLSTGTIGNAGSDFFNAQITSVGNGWYRISALTLSGGNIYISLVSSNTAGWLESWAMPNNTDGVLIMNGQLEAGVLTEFIGNTTTTAVSVGPVSGLPRLDYYDSTCPKLLLEPQRTNSLTYSEQIGGTNWSFYFGSLTQNTTETLDPSGYYGAEKVVMGTGNQAVFRQSIGGLTNGATYTLSLYIKQGSGVTGFLDICDSAGAVDITPTNEWVRYTKTGVWNTAANYIDLEFRGTDGSAYCYIWGAQLEAGAYATSYIPTLGTSVTRVVENIPSKTTLLSNKTAYSIFLDFYPRPTSTFTYFFQQLNSSQDSEIIWGGSSGGNDFAIYDYTVSGSVAVVDINDGNRHKIVLTQIGNKIDVFVDGQKVRNQFTTAATGFYYFNMGGNPGIYKINTLMTMPALTDSNAIELTTL